MRESTTRHDDGGVWASDPIPARRALSADSSPISSARRRSLLIGNDDDEEEEEEEEELVGLKESCRGKWVLCGDFNSIRCQEERRGKTWSSRASELFNNTISTLGLIDPPMSNQCFTWSNMQDNPTLARLDRFLLSTEWECEFPLYTVVGLPRATSDHCPILLSVDGVVRKPKKFFRFEAAWLNHQGFVSNLPLWWREGSAKRSAILTFTAKLRHCRRRIVEWCFDDYYSVRKEKSKLRGEIQEIDKEEECCELPQETVARREELREELNRVLKDEEVMWRTRAKQLWLREGDSNTKFFHAVANERKRNNRIDTLEDGASILSEEGDKINHLYQKFKDLYTPEEPATSSLGDWSGLFRSNRVSDSNLAVLTSSFSHEEVKKAVFQLGRDKAPGPDGFPLSFYQTFWDTLQGDILNIFQDLYEGNLSTGPIDYAYICLIPKKTGPRKAEDYRPISLLNGIQKIVSKVLANRMEVTMSELISRSQSAFLKGRNITDAFATTREVIDWGGKKAVEGVGVKVDFEKAYDRVSWDFLFRILEWWGFSQKWCNWIRLCVCNAKVAVLVNGETTKWIKTKRGIRQGDPLSPFLFLLVAECLARITAEAHTNNLIQGIGPSENSRTSLVQFADDTFFFCKATKKCMTNLKFIWKLFEWASGMRVNREKTELFYLGRISGKARSLAQVLGCKEGSLPTTYLGLPLSTKPPTKDDWWRILNKMQHRIEGWQAKLLSRGGRLVLVNAVLTNLPLYFLSTFKAPVWVVKYIERLRRDFFWRGDNTAVGRGCLVSWGRVCRSKRDGGLGILDIGTMNRALLLKWWWKFFTEQELQWRMVIHDLFYRRRIPLHEGRTFRPTSAWWTGILQLRDIFKWSVAYKLGNGRSINFWLDRWCGETTLEHSFPEIYEIVMHKNRKVSDCAGNDSWCWARIIGTDHLGNHGSSSRITELRARVLNFRPTRGPDRPIWRWSSDGRFTVKSSYLSLRDGGMRDGRVSGLWKLHIPLKVKIFCWLVLLKKAPTTANLAKKGWSGNTTCVLCGSEEESIDHLFAGCVVFRYVAFMSVENVLPVDLARDVNTIWVRWAQRKATVGNRSGLTGLAACWWLIWELRNDTIFKHKRSDPVAGIHKTKQLMSQWE